MQIADNMATGLCFIFFIKVETLKETMACYHVGRQFHACSLSRSHSKEVTLSYGMKWI
jgi:hypothetical protein